MFKITVTTPATFSAVSAADLQTWLRLNDSGENTLLASLADAAADKWTTDTEGHVLCSQSLRLSLDHWPTVYQGYAPYGDQSAPFPYPWNVGLNTQLPTACIYIPRHPVTSITSVQYLDPDGTWQTLSGCSFDTTNTPARVVLPQSVPQLHPTQRPAVRVNFVAGYADASSIPAAAVVGVKLLCSHWYGNRTAFDDKDSKPVAQGWDALTAKYRLGTFGDWNK
jgi:hypothetical protein